MTGRAKYRLPGIKQWLPGRPGRWVIYILLFCAVFGDFIANEKPIVFREDGRYYFPAISGYLTGLGLDGNQYPQKDWHNTHFEFVLRAPIPYSSSYIDLENARFRSPFGKQDVESWYFRHWLGTDALGRDVLAGLVRGCRIALVIGLLSTIFALLIGLPAGIAMGYWGNTGIRISVPGCVITLLGGVLFVFGISVIIQIIADGAYGMMDLFVYLFVTGVLMALAIWLSGYLTRRLGGRMSMVPVPLDQIGMRLIEVFRSIPGLFLVLACLGLMVHPSAFFIAFLIGFIRWPTIARYIRAEVMKVKEKGFIQSAKSLGLPEYLVIFRHLLPNALGPVIVTVAFGFSSAILVESALSFLGLGLGIEEMSWGKLLNQARSQFDAWWLVLFPGLMIFLSVYIFNRIGDRLSEILDPRLRS